MYSLRKRIYLSLLVAIALVLSIVESFLPAFIMVPGAKLGFANIILLTTIVVFGFKESLIIAILKSLLLVLGTGNVIGLMYSLPAGIVSCLVMNIIYRNFSYKRPIFSLIGVSIVGAVFHNISQITVAALVLRNINIFSYLWIMILISIVTGFFIGLTSIFITDRFFNDLSKFRME